MDGRISQKIMESSNEKWTNENSILSTKIYHLQLFTHFVRCWGSVVMLTSLN